jgi:HEAT repeat protein
MLANMLNILRRTYLIVPFAAAAIQPAMATTPPPEIPCYLTKSEAAFGTLPSQSRKASLRKILQESPDLSCTGKQLFSKNGSTKDLPLLVKLMESDTSPDVRRRAADALGAVLIGQKTALDALGAGLTSERNMQVLLARIGSIDQQLSMASGARWAKSSKLADALNSLASLNTDERTPQEKEELRIAVGRLICTIGFKLSGPPDIKLSPEERKDTWRRLSRLFNEIMKREPGVQVVYYGWQVLPLDVLLHGVEIGEVGFGTETDAVSTMNAAMTELGDPNSQVRAASLKLMSALQERVVARAEPGWHDFAPYLKADDAKRLSAASAALLADEAPEVRAEAVRMLGLLTLDGGTYAQELVNALHDESPSVRKQAALALALRPALPNEAAPLLIELALQRGIDSPAAIAALSQDRSQAALETLVEIASKPDAENPDADYEERELAEVRAKTVVRAVAKFGAQAILPLLRKTAQVSDAKTQSNLYVILDNVGWTGLARQSDAEVEAALAPALTGESEQARLFALALLAQLPPRDGHRFASTLVEELLGRYLQDAPAEMPADVANPKYIWLDDRPEQSWHVVPAAAAAIVAGGSSSGAAAQKMVAWLCSGSRLELREKSGGLIITSGGSPLSNEMETATAVVHSLSRMGALAKPFVDSALADKDSTELCKRYLGQK